VLRGKDEQAQASVSNEGRGKYKQVEHENDQNIADAQEEIKKYKADAETSMDQFKADMDRYQDDLKRYAAGQLSSEPVKPEAPSLKDPPEVKKAVPIPDDLSGYVDFLHPWGGVWLNPIALLLMFFGLVVGSILALRSQDIG
jgi:hypothetical protein